MLRFTDSFDHYSTLLEKWTTTGGGVSIQAGQGRRGGQSFRVNSGQATKTIDAQPTWIVGFALRFSTNNSSINTLVRLLDGATTQVDLRINADSTLSVVRAGAAVTGGTSVIALSPNTYYYIELKVTISSSIAAGSWKVRVNGVDAITVATGQSSREHGQCDAPAWSSSDRPATISAPSTWTTCTSATASIRA